ncbi:GNAT family N-acetyltransferase [bacterium]|nr:GNAT family N-acetyltransferase [bacterium]
MSKPFVRPGTLNDATGYNACLGRVAEERRYIGVVTCPAVEGSREWIKSLLDSQSPFYVVEERDNIIGWCDVARRSREGFSHAAELGMGLDLEYRGQGLGNELLKHVIEASKACGIEKVELDVFGSNTAARKLYERFGFTVDGIKPKARKLDGVYDDIVCMSLFLV